MTTAPEQRTLLPGHSRVRSVWTEPSPAGRLGHSDQEPDLSGIRPSEGRWVERDSAVHARSTIALPVSAELRIF